MPPIDIEALFTYHTPTPDQLVKLQAVRAKAKELGHIILANSPPSADQSAAIRLLRECVMTVNASIVLDGKLERSASA